jgi:hypothetical protein
VSALDRHQESSILPEPGRRLSRKRRASPPTGGCPRVLALRSASSRRPGSSAAAAPRTSSSAPRAWRRWGGLDGGDGSSRGGRRRAHRRRGGLHGWGIRTGGEPALRCREDQDCPPPAVCIAGAARSVTRRKPAWPTARRGSGRCASIARAAAAPRWRRARTIRTASTAPAGGRLSRGAGRQPALWSPELSQPHHRARRCRSGLSALLSRGSVRSGGRLGMRDPMRERLRPVSAPAAVT